MANLSEIIVRKNQNDEQWKAQKQAERENAAAMQDAGMEEISATPTLMPGIWRSRETTLVQCRKYCPCYGTESQYHPVWYCGRWKTLGRSVPEGERGKGVQIFQGLLWKGYFWYRLMTFPRPLAGKSKKPVLQDGSLAMESALSTLLNYSIVPVVVDTGNGCACLLRRGEAGVGNQPQLPGWRSLWGHCDRGGPQSVPCQGRKHPL